jgi:hypothetical protein
LFECRGALSSETAFFAVPADPATEGCQDDRAASHLKAIECAAAAPRRTGAGGFDGGQQETSALNLRYANFIRTRSSGAIAAGQAQTDMLPFLEPVDRIGALHGR